MSGRHAKRPGTTNLLVQVPDDVHAIADRRRRRENITWSMVISTLLKRWADGADVHVLKAPVHMARPTAPNADEAERLHRKWMQENPAYARACTEPVDISKLTRYRSVGELLAATAVRESRPVPPELVAAADDEQGDEGVDG
jgi:hypothetical protein